MGVVSRLWVNKDQKLPTTTLVSEITSMYTGKIGKDIESQQDPMSAKYRGGYTEATQEDRDDTDEPKKSASGSLTPNSTAAATPSSASTSGGNNGKASAQIKWMVLAFLIFQNSSASILMRASRTGSQWNSQTAVIMQELIKAVLCVGLLLRSGGLKALTDSMAFKLETVKTSVPAILYLFQNNMQYVAVNYLDASTYAILYQLKILTAALMSVLILQKPLNAMQWVALVFLTTGASVVIVSQMKPKVDISDSGDPMGEGGVTLGVVAVLLACLASGMAGVYFEKLLKGSTVSLWERNLHLALFSLIVGIPSLLPTLQDDGLSLDAFFKGYTRTVWASIINNAFGGLLIAIVIKYADNIMKNFSATLSIVLTTIVSVFMFGSQINAMSVAGTALVLYAVFLYGGMSGVPQLLRLAGIR
mmetsp:Transcript_91534/g.191338  ORF Transcript_91534/g.191338 Transcript_91534/m.191338 type:complete len:418 (+) Transcript_91534:32-1285(+)